MTNSFSKFTETKDDEINRFLNEYGENYSIVERQRMVQFLKTIRNDALLKKKDIPLYIC